MECKKIITSPEGYKVCADNGVIISEDIITDLPDDYAGTYLWIESAAITLKKIDVEDFCSLFRESPSMAIKKYGTGVGYGYRLASILCGYIPRRHWRKLRREELEQIYTWASSLNRRPTWREIRELAEKYNVHHVTIYRWLRRWGFI